MVCSTFLIIDHFISHSKDVRLTFGTFRHYQVDGGNGILINKWAIKYFLVYKMRPLVRNRKADVKKLHSFQMDILPAYDITEIYRLEICLILVHVVLFAICS